ncbi:MAG TPA: hypothetical protein VMB26_05015 [Candidatus Binataceae bacterium]|nr:hypothetical protein [Candidatus Binataceae bacterium]
MEDSAPDTTGSKAASDKSSRFPLLFHWGLNRRQTALLAGILLLTTLAFLRTLNNGFVYDDFPALVRNARLRHWSFIWDSLTRDVWWYYAMAHPPESSYYRPIQNVCLGLGFQLAGLHAAGWHFLKILLHLSVVLAVFRLAQLLTANTVIGLLVALLFALMPSNGAAVISIQAMGEPLAAGFAMGSLSVFIRRSSTGWRGTAIAMILFAFAAFSHETAVLFPLLVAVYVFLFETGSELRGEPAPLTARIGQSILSSAPFFVVAMLYIGARALVLGPEGTFGLMPHKLYVGGTPVPVSLFQPHPLFTSAQILMTIPTVLVHYVELLIFPWMAEPSHDVNGVMAPSFSELFVPLGILALLALTGYLIFRNSPRAKLYLFCAIWWFVSLAPAFSFNHIVAFVQDRYLYLASFAFCLWVGTWLIDFVGDSVVRSRAVAVAVAALIAFDIAKLWRLEPIWHDNLRLFTRCVDDFPDSPYYHRILASTLMKNGDFAAAAGHLRYIYKPKTEENKKDNVK